MRHLTLPEAFLSDLLDCGANDLEVFEDIGYDFTDILESIKEEYQLPNLNTIIETCFSMGITDLKAAIQYHISDLQEKENYLKEKIHALETEILDIEADLKDLQSLDPDTDIETYTDYLDSSISIKRNKHIYVQQLSKDMETIFKQMGFYIS